MEPYRDKQGQGQIFKNPFLEKFTKTSFWITFIFYPALILTLLYFNHRFNDFNWGLCIGVYLTGLFSWSLVEYLMHRFLFHFINENKLVQRFHYMLHGVHHEFPRDEQRLFMPPVPGLIIVTALFALHYIFLREYTFLFVGGLVNGYCIYVYIHHATHARKPFKAFKYLWKHHALHHYKYPDKAYGVSSPLWDYVFGTMPPKQSKD